jgi:hypothetical protein
MSSITAEKYKTQWAFEPLIVIFGCVGSIVDCRWVGVWFIPNRLWMEKESRLAKTY